MKLLFVLLSLFAGTAALAGGIELQSHNATSGRDAVLDDDGTVAFLYLTGRNTPDFERDAIAYMRVAPLEEVDQKRRRVAGDPPLLSKDIASSEAVILQPVEAEFSFKWSRDGESVALAYRGSPIALASSSEKRGYSKAVAKVTSIANPWSDMIYAALFGR